VVEERPGFARARSSAQRRTRPLCERFRVRTASYHRLVAETTQPLGEQLEEIRTQLDWVRDYL
jgi:hypothetical protein